MKAKLISILLLTLYPLISSSQIVENKDISMRDFPIDFAHMIGVEGDPKISDGMASYAIINGVVTCKKMPALSLAKRDRIPKEYQAPFRKFSTVDFQYREPNSSIKYHRDLVFNDGSPVDEAILTMCADHKTVKASVFVLEPPGADGAPQYNFLKSIKPL
jgi:hypothetical protein